MEIKFSARKAAPHHRYDRLAMQGDREMCLTAGMNDYISKPFKVKELVTALYSAARRTQAGCPDPC